MRVQTSHNILQIHLLNWTAIQDPGLLSMAFNLPLTCITGADASGVGCELQTQQLNPIRCHHQTHQTNIVQDPLSLSISTWLITPCKSRMFLHLSLQILYQYDVINESHKKLAPPKDKSLGRWEARDHWCCSGKALGKWILRSDLIECFWHDFGLEFDSVLNWIKPPFTSTCRIQFEYELSWYSVPIKSELILRLFWFGIWVWFQFELNLSTLSS